MAKDKPSKTQAQKAAEKAEKAAAAAAGREAENAANIKRVAADALASAVSKVALDNYPELKCIAEACTDYKRTTSGPRWGRSIMRRSNRLSSRRSRVVIALTTRTVTASLQQRPSLQGLNVKGHCPL